MEELEDLNLTNINKLGLPDEKMKYIESEIIEAKSRLISKEFTFDTSYYGIIYLIRLHEFLYGDLYFDGDKMSEKFFDSDKEILDQKILKVVSSLNSRDKDTDYIVRLMQELKDEEIFDIGNSETMDIFYKLIIDFYIKDESYKTILMDALKSNERKF